MTKENVNETPVNPEETPDEGTYSASNAGADAAGPDGSTGTEAAADTTESTDAANNADEHSEGAQQAGSADSGNAAAEVGSESAANLQKEIESLRSESNEYQQRYLRTQADFDNFRRRSRQEKEEFAKYASAKLVEQLLPVLDNLQRALDSSKQTGDFEALAKGVEMTYRQLEQSLAQEGLEAIEAIGRPFNPEVHQAIMQVESEEHEEGIVVEEIVKGYRLKDRVLRPAMVKVSQ